MSELDKTIDLKLFYDHKINKRKIDVTHGVMDNVQNGRGKKLVKNVSLSSMKSKSIVILSVLAIVFALGFTYIHEFSLTDSNGNPWHIQFLNNNFLSEGSEKKIQEKSQKIIENLDLEPGDSALVFINDHNPNSTVYGIDYLDSIENIQYTNNIALETFNFTMEDSFYGLEFTSASISVDSSISHLSDFLLEKTPKGEYSYLLKEAGEELVFYCSDESVIIDQMPTYIDENVESVIYSYGTFDFSDDLRKEYIQLRLGRSFVDEPSIEVEEKYSTNNNEVISLGGRDVWLHRDDTDGERPQCLSLYTVEAGVTLSLDLYQETIDEEEIIREFEHLLEKLY